MSILVLPIKWGSLLNLTSKIRFCYKMYIPIFYGLQFLMMIRPRLDGNRPKLACHFDESCDRGLEHQIAEFGGGDGMPLVKWDLFTEQCTIGA